MARKCIRTLILVIMELLLPILVQVRAIDLAPTSYGPSSLPVPLSDFSELDEVEKNGPMGVCLKSQIEHCKRERRQSGDEGHYKRSIYSI